jgi:hypothetical protein
MLGKCARNTSVSVKKICGKLNVQREIFRVQEDGQYTWAGEE